MKRKKDVIKKAVLASVLAMSLNNVVWAAEGVDQPFSTVSELEALGGIASIDSSSISLDTTNATLEQSLAALLRTIQSYCVSGCPWQSRNRA